MTWGPFRPDLDWPERKARLRSLRTCLRILVGERGRAAGVAVLRAEVAGEAETGLLDAAEREFSALTPLDQRRVLATFGAVQAAE